jgi:hypothetical protein
MRWSALGGALLRLYALELAWASSDVLLATLPATLDGQCRCCAELWSRNATLDIHGSAASFCSGIGDARVCGSGSVVVTADDCVETVEMALWQRLRLLPSAVLLPLTVNGHAKHFYSQYVLYRACMYA